MTITSSIILFLLAAGVGLIMATRVFLNRPIPAGLAVTHGILGATGLLVLLIVVTRGTDNITAAMGLIILLIAALGGFFLLSFHLRKLPHPKSVVVIHALAAVIGVLTLIAAISL